MLVDGQEALQRFLSLGSGRSESVELLRARDGAFCRYGAVARFVTDRARCTASVDSHSLDGEGHPLGQIGDLVFPDEAPALRSVLEPALEWLLGRGCRAVQASITRHTWYPFRIVTGGFDACPPFEGEPWNPPWTGPRLREAGFGPVAWYVSSWTVDASRHQIERSRPKLEHLREAGYRVRPFDPGRATEDLGRIHGITLRAFAPPLNHLFHPVDMEELRLVLWPGIGGLDPRLLLLCETSDGEPAGYVYLTREGPAVASVKTLAVAPEHRSAGLGGALVARAHEVCQSLGIGRVIHALMRVGSSSTSISDTGGHEVFRRYEVLERRL